jgi:FKBP-type peptidyl-prolyl cis-trans isomerase
VLTLLAVPAAMAVSCGPASALVQGYEPMPALKDKDYGKPRMTYSDYITTASGLQYQDLKVGDGPSPQSGNTCIVDW